ncbi:MAG TPA: iron-containing alcohol dehydrogenase, partial [Anaerovoracaceae bacterium]|nr:iron-containing alcohol dehydrogenase [Anaerovoracaceae bacterium]
MNEFTFSIPQNIVCGTGTINKLPEIISNCGYTKAFIISGQVLTRLGVVAQVSALITTSGFDCAVFNNVEVNPSIKTVDAATEAYKKSGADCIIALGGGSPMDVAKAVGVLAVYGGSITDYEGAEKVPGKIVPIIAIPTTAGTGSEVTAFTVITDHSRNYKLTVFSYNIIPEYALLDSELIISLPMSVAAATGIDALVHAIEAYLSTAASLFSDAMAEKAMELIGGSIRTFCANRKNITAAENMLMGSTFAGIAFAWARLGNVHAMAHPLSGFFDIPHGVANAILLPVVLEYNSIADKGKYKKIYDYINSKNYSEKNFTTDMLVDEIRALTESLGIPKNLSSIG